MPQAAKQYVEHSKLLNRIWRMKYGIGKRGDRQPSQEEGGGWLKERKGVNNALVEETMKRGKEMRLKKLRRGTQSARSLSRGVGDEQTQKLITAVYNRAA